MLNGILNNEQGILKDEANALLRSYEEDRMTIPFVLCSFLQEDGKTGRTGKKDIVLSEFTGSPTSLHFCPITSFSQVCTFAFS
jgi:hypothetical protein